MKQLLSQGAFVDDIYYCPHHTEHGVYPYRQECDCRKPHTGLIKKAVKRHNIDLKQSFMVGDKLSDIDTGKRAEIKTVLVLTGYGKEILKDLKQKPDHVAEDLLEGVKWILKK